MAEISEETRKIALESVTMVYAENIVWLQIHGREKDFTNAIDELEKKAPPQPSPLSKNENGEGEERTVYAKEDAFIGTAQSTAGQLAGEESPQPPFTKGGEEEDDQLGFEEDPEEWK